MDLTAEGAWPQRVAEWAAFAAAILGGGWALWTFDRNRRTKAAEILVNLEKEYTANIIKHLLEIEYLSKYHERYRGALKKVQESVGTGKLQFTQEESASINDLETVLRHFFLCRRLRRLGVDGLTLDASHTYYLHVLTNVEKRPELVWYIKRYWPTVFEWAEECRTPPIVRPWLHLKRVPKRIGQWFSVKEALPDEVSVSTTSTVT